MRLDKFLAHNGFGSRSDVRVLIKNKRVKVNDQVVRDAGLILNLDTDSVAVNGTMVNYIQDVYLMMNKPKGYECTHTSENYPSVLELIDMVRKDLIFVGRLDADTEGLLLITNDGQFSHEIAHGKKDHSKDYYVELEHPFNASFIPTLEEGMPFEDGFLKPAKVAILEPNKIILSIREGKYHQVKRMMHFCENEVQYLKRIRIGSLELDESLELGEYRTLTPEEVGQFI